MGTGARNPWNIYIFIVGIITMMAITFLGIILDWKKNPYFRKKAEFETRIVPKGGISLALFCAVIPAGSLGLSHFVFNHSGNGKIISILLGFLLAGLMLALRIWRMEKKNI